MGRNSLEMFHGQQSERCFKGLAERRGYTVIKTSPSIDMMKHVDFILTREEGEERFGVDIKARKKASRQDDSYDDEHVWVEFHNVRGDPGWLYGGADKIAFEQADRFIVVNRVTLKEYCETTVVPFFVDNSREAIYKCRQRPNRKDVISLIPVADIIHPYSFTEEVEIWKKELDKIP